MVLQRVCVCCACDPSVRLDNPSICFMCVFVCRKLSPHLSKSLRAGAQVSVLLLCCFFCILCGQLRACSCYASCPLVCCTCLSSV